MLLLADILLDLLQAQCVHLKLHQFFVGFHFLHLFMRGQLFVFFLNQLCQCFLLRVFSIFLDEFEL